MDRGSIQTTPSAPKPMGCSCGPFACHCYTAFARAKPAFIKILPTAAVVLWLWIQLAWISRVRHGFLYHWILPFTFHFSGFSSHFFYTHTHTHTHTRTPSPHTHTHTHTCTPPHTTHMGQNMIRWTNKETTQCQTHCVTASWYENGTVSSLEVNTGK